MWRRALLLSLAACRSDADTMPDAPFASDAPPGTFPAFRPPVPQLVTAGAHVIAHPVIVPIYFTGDPDQAQLDAFLPTLIGSLHWAVLGEYGVGSATIASSVVLTDAQPQSIDVAGAGAFLAGKLDGTHPEFGPVDATSLASRVFVLYYTSAQLPSCGALRGAVAVGAGLANFVLVPNCMVIHLAGDRTADASAGIAAAATNPLDASGASTGVTGFDPAHAAWGTFDREVSTVCGTTDLGGLSAARMWSNAQARAYRDPCVPAPEPVYFATAAIASDDLGARGTGIAVSLGGNATIELDMFSDDLLGAWQVTATDQGNTANPIALPTGASGENGDMRTLSITGSVATTTGLVELDSTLDGNTTRWFVPFTVQ